MICVVNSLRVGPGLVLGELLGGLLSIGDGLEQTLFVVLSRVETVGIFCGKEFPTCFMHLLAGRLLRTPTATRRHGRLGTTPVAALKLI